MCVLLREVGFITFHNLQMGKISLLIFWGWSTECGQLYLPKGTQPLHSQCCPPGCLTQNKPPVLSIKQKGGGRTQLNSFNRRKGEERKTIQKHKKMSVVNKNVHRGEKIDVTEHKTVLCHLLQTARGNRRGRATSYGTCLFSACPVRCLFLLHLQPATASLIQPRQFKVPTRQKKKELWWRSQRERVERVTHVSNPQQKVQQQDHTAGAEGNTKRRPFELPAALWFLI